jgi:hypothetical protein
MERSCLSVLFAVTVICTSAQPQLPGMWPSDTISIPCPYDTTVIIRTYQGWEAYHTLDDSWHGIRDSTFCIDLVHLNQSGWPSPRILFDQIDVDRPVFLRALLTDENALPLTADNQYTIGFSAYGPTSFDLGDCPDGPCTSMRAAIRIPDEAGSGTDLRWHETAPTDDMWAAYPFNLCLPTEKFEMNDLREFIVSLKAVAPQPGGSFSLWSPEISDLDLFSDLIRLTEDVLPQYAIGPATYLFNGSWGANYLVMHEDEGYPSPDNISYLDFLPQPNVAEQVPLSVTLAEYSGFNFQPYAQLRGGLVAGSDSLRHPLEVINEGADLCLSSQIVELVWEPGDRYVHRAGHLEFHGLRSCFMFKPGSALVMDNNSVLHYGRNGRGMLALFEGSNFEMRANSHLLLEGPLVLLDPPDMEEAKDMRIVLRDNARLTFLRGSRIMNHSSLGGNKKLVVILDGGHIDLHGLELEDREKVVVIRLPVERVTNAVLLGNPVGEELVMSLASREAGTLMLRCLDPLGRSVMATDIGLGEGENLIRVPVHHLKSGAYLVETVVHGERQVVRFIKE